MLKLENLLNLESHYHPRPRFYWILLSIIILLLLIIFADKLAGIVPETLFTSPYWQSVARG
jgi:hypothetical protein